MLSIERDSTVPYYQQIYQQIAALIEEGIYHPGERLPSLRQTATSLNVSRNTVEQAYTLLTQQGYVDAHAGSGYLINPREKKPRRTGDFDQEYKSSLLQLSERTAKSDALRGIVYDFSYDRMDQKLFPFSQWARSTRNVLCDSNIASLCGYSDRMGLAELRSQISEYLVREQDICATPEQILIQSNTYMSIHTILQLFDSQTCRVTVEDPGFPDVANACRIHGFDIVPYSLYPRNSWSDFVAGDHGSGLVFTTPSNQYPTNATMSVADREALVAWADENEAYLVEDVYCHEFQYNLEHPPSLHALDTKGRVITMGTFSKSIAPSLSICYLVLPPQLMMKWLAQPSPMHSPVPWQMQATLADFMSGGYWYQHLHKLQTTCRKKYLAIIQAIDEYMGDNVEHLEYKNGLHVLITTRDGRSANDLLHAAARNGVRLHPTQQAFFDKVPDDWRYVLMGYAGISLNMIEPGVKALAKAWGYV